jgi:hypothetical protein
MTDTPTHILRARLDELDRAVLAAINSNAEFAAHLRFVAEVRDAIATGGLQANGFPPVPLAPAPNADFVQPLSEDAHQRRELNLKFNPVADPELPLEPVDAKATKAAP